MRIGRFGAAITYVILAISALLILSPLIYILLNSFKTPRQIMQVPPTILPSEWTLQNFIEVFNHSRFVGYLSNSVFITIFGVLLTVVLASLAGYGFARFKFRGNGLLFGAMLFTVTVPLVIFLIPLFLMELSWGILNTRMGLLLPNVAALLPFAVLIMRAAYLEIPKEIEEAARVDGCGALKTWWSVMQPMTQNSLALVVILASYTIWGEYTLAKALATRPEAMPVTVGVTLLKGETWQLGLMAAVIVISVIPPVIVFLIFQRYIVAGVAMGAVKQ